MEDSEVYDSVNDDKPESIEISSGSGLLAGRTPYWKDDSDVVFTMPPAENQGGVSNRAWFASGMFLAPAAMWVISMIFFTIADSIYLNGGSEDLEWMMNTIGTMVWPVGIVGSVIWGFTKGNKNFAFGVLTTFVGAPILLLILLIVAILILT